MSEDFLRIRAVMASTGHGCKTSIYNRVRDGLLPPPGKDGGISFWPSGEIEEVKRAILAGYTKAEIRKLVADIVARRSQRAAA